MKSEIYMYSDQGRRPENEDFAYVAQPGKDQVLAILADGLGGHGGGAIASRTAVQYLARMGAKKPMPAPEEVRQWLENANQEIIAKRDGPNRMRTTVVYLSVSGSRAMWSHIGDSRLYHFHNGILTDYTRDHSMTQIAVLQGEITRNEMGSHPDRSRLIRAMGSEDIEPDVNAPQELAPGHHAFLLCSDGFWEFLKEEEIMVDLHKSETPGQWVEFLRRRGEKRKENVREIDNNTAAAVFVTI